MRIPPGWPRITRAVSLIRELFTNTSVTFVPAFTWIPDAPTLSTAESRISNRCTLLPTEMPAPPQLRTATRYSLMSVVTPQAPMTSAPVFVCAVQNTVR